jgi:hypothetical protein
VSLRARLDMEARRKSFASTRDRTLVVQSLVRHYIVRIKTMALK